jgi:hypothetical protein
MISRFIPRSSGQQCCGSKSYHNRIEGGLNLTSFFSMAEFPDRGLWQGDGDEWPPGDGDEWPPGDDDEWPPGDGDPDKIPDGSSVSVGTGGAHVCAALPAVNHSPEGRVMRMVKGIGGLRPSRSSQRLLRALFPVTGRITREQRRESSQMAAAFEAHESEILTEMQRPEILEMVVRIIVNGNKRLPDRDLIRLHALRFLDGAGLPRSWAQGQ